MFQGCKRPRFLRLKNGLQGVQALAVLLTQPDSQLENSDEQSIARRRIR